MLPVAVAWSSSDSVAIRYVFPVLQMTSYFHTMGPIGGWARRSMVCHCDGASGHGHWPLAWQAGLFGRLGCVDRTRHTGNNAGCPAAGLVCCWDRAPWYTFCLCFMLVVSCAPDAKSAIYDCLFIIRPHRSLLVQSKNDTDVAHNNCGI